MSHLNFCILAFSTNFCTIKTNMSGNTVWLQASGFQKLAKMDHFWTVKWDIFQVFNNVFNVFKRKLPFGKNFKKIARSPIMTLLLMIKDISKCFSLDGNWKVISLVSSIALGLNGGGGGLWVSWWVIYGMDFVYEHGVGWRHTKSYIRSIFLGARSIFKDDINSCCCFSSHQTSFF